MKNKIVLFTLFWTLLSIICINPVWADNGVDKNGVKASLHQVVLGNIPNGLRNDIDDKKLLLGNLIELCKGLSDQSYIPNTWSPFITALDEAKSVYDNAESTEQQITEALENLTQAKEGLSERPVKSPLAILIDSYRKLEESSYTPESWVPLQDAIEKATDVYNDENATKEDVGRAIDELNVAAGNLVINDSLISVLKTFIEIAKEEWEKGKDTCTPNSLKYLDETIKEAEALCMNPSVTEAEIEQMLDKLIDALARLIVLANREHLEELIAECSQLIDNPSYTKESMKILKEVLEEAKKICEDLNAIQYEVDNAYNELLKAKNQLALAQNPPETYYNIEIEAAANIISETGTGSFPVEAGEALYIRFYAEDEDGASYTNEDILFLIDGVPTSFRTSGSYFVYTLTNIQDNHNILIALKQYPVTVSGIIGVPTDPADGVHCVPYGEPFTLTVTPVDGYDYSEMQVFVDGVEWETGDSGEDSFIYTIDRIVAPTSVTIEGVYRGGGSDPSTDPGDPDDPNDPDNPTSNATTEETVKVYTSNGNLYIQTTSPITVDIYTVTGIRKANRIVNGSETFSLTSGIYLVKTDQKVTKIIVN